MPHTTEKIDYDVRFAKTLTVIQQALAEIFDPADATGGGFPLNAAPIEGPEHLWHAMRYATLDAGKLIRPVLTLESCRACGGNLRDALATACAVEMVHAQSLIHDDLPCMDDDALRRGKPTVHKAFDEATAVLAGDALLAMAFGVICKRSPKTIAPATLLAVIDDFSDVSSVQGLVNGQFVDIYYENRPFDADVLTYIHRYKTGALFRFCARSGARLAGAPEPVIEGLSRFGETIGLAFQIVDDLLDVQSSPEAMGKATGKDAAKHKATYPALYGVQDSRHRAEQLITEATDLLDSLKLVLPSFQTDALKTLARFMAERIR